MGRGGWLDVDDEEGFVVAGVGGYEVAVRGGGKRAWNRKGYPQGAPIQIGDCGWMAEGAGEGQPQEMRVTPGIGSGGAAAFGVGDGSDCGP